MANAASNQAIGTTSTNIFKGACSKFKVGCRSESANEVFVTIKELHGRDKFPVFPGGEETFETGGNSINLVDVVSAGTSVIDYGVVGKAN